MTPLETEANPNIRVGPLRWGRPVLADHTTGSAFRNIQLIFHVVDRLAFSRGAQNFLLRCPSDP